MQYEALCRLLKNVSFFVCQFVQITPDYVFWHWNKDDRLVQLQEMLTLHL